MNLIENKVRGVFIPVSNIEQARDWYCRLFNLPNDGEILFGHIYVLPMQGDVDIVLDSQIYAPDRILQVPFVQLATPNIEQSYAYMQSLEVELLTEIENGHWFTFRDPDGNVLMVCQ